MPIYDKNGIPILGKEDDANKKIQELSQSVLMAKGVIQEFKDKLEFSKAQNLNLLIFLSYLMEKTDNNRFRISIKILNSLRTDFLNGKFILKTYSDQAKNIVICKEIKKENERTKEREENGRE